MARALHRWVRRLPEVNVLLRVTIPRMMPSRAPARVFQVPRKVTVQQAPVSRRSPDESERVFLIYLYLGTVFVRWAVGIVILLSGYLEFFGGDQLTYDTWGWGLAQAWAGTLQNTKWVYDRMRGYSGTNGMYYWVAVLYSIFGHSQIIAMICQSAIVSFTPILTYKISFLLYGSRKAARYASLLVAFLPSMVIWSSLLLKDPVIIFLLCTTVYCALKTQRELQYVYIIPATLAMLPILSIRAYVFYFILFSLAASYFMSRFGSKLSLRAYLARLCGIAVIGCALFAIGFDEIVAAQLKTNVLEKIQSSRTDLARSGYSGFGTSAKVSTIQDALAFMPTGITYLVLAPFPWQGGGLRQMLALPEQVVWYALFPFFIIGMIYTARRHLRDALIIFLFVVQLTCFYGIFVGNVGTAHRQRTQVFVFYLIFTAAGIVYSKAKRQGQKATISD